ncbi:hypothetical protein GCM10027429_19820 [Marivirga atlantica]|uniref:PAS domain S-box protein n=1 Tax=Marivirga atlantica TaxID=1548457 RepID=A0A937AB43_9BACT|nr:PAS domain S-box protein [Marivirga atlantica]MBL0765600.1 PAS domain S-box protein [Marivirga atlantica]
MQIGKNKIDDQSLLWGRFFKKAFLFGTGSFFLVAILCYFAISISFKVYKQQEHENMDAQLDIVKSRISRVMRITNLEAFNVALQISDAGTIMKIDSVGEAIIQRNPFISGIEIVPDGIITEVYPYERHKEALNLNILQLPSARASAMKAVETKKIFYAGPLELKQGGEALIARLPIFRRGKFWGFSAIIIDFDAFIEEAGMRKTNDDNVHVKFSRMDPSTGNEEVFLDFDGNYSQKKTYEFEDSNWVVSVYSAINDSVYFVLVFFILTSFMISIGAGYFIYERFKKPIILENQLDEKSKELLRQNDYFSSLINAIPDFVFIVDKDCVLLNFHSSSLEGLVDKTLNFIGKSVDDYLGKETSQKLRRKVRYTLINNEDTSHNYHLILDGKKEYFEARIVRINENEALVLVRNISKIVQANTRLYESENKYRHLVQQAPDCIFHTDTDGLILSVNKAGLAMTGYSRKDLENKNIDVCIKLDNAEENLSSYLKKTSLTSHSAIIYTANGEEIAAEVSASVAPDGTILGIARDITERKKYIDSIEQQNDKLKEIAWIQSHEVRAPLSKILSLIDYFKHSYSHATLTTEEILAHVESASHELDKKIREIVKKAEEAEK